MVRLDVRCGPPFSELSLCPLHRHAQTHRQTDTRTDPHRPSVPLWLFSTKFPTWKIFTEFMIEFYFQSSSPNDLSYRERKNAWDFWLKSLFHIFQLGLFCLLQHHRLKGKKGKGKERRNIRKTFFPFFLFFPSFILRSSLPWTWTTSTSHKMSATLFLSHFPHIPHTQISKESSWSEWRSMLLARLCGLF